MNEVQHTRVKQLVQSLQDLSESRRDRRKEYQDLDVANLVFYHPPSSDAPPLHLQPCHDLDVVRHDSSRDPFFLRHDVLENTGYLRYEEWLLDRHTFVANLLNHTSTQVQLHASVLLHDLAADVDKTKDEHRREDDVDGHRQAEEGDGEVEGLVREDARLWFRLGICGHMVDGGVSDIATYRVVVFGANVAKSYVDHRRTQKPTPRRHSTQTSIPQLWQTGVHT